MTALIVAWGVSISAGTLICALPMHYWRGPLLAVSFTSAAIAALTTLL